MNDAHLHLIVNHYPVIGCIFGLGILIVGLLQKNKAVKNVAYSLFITAAVFGFFSMYTGEGAEEIVEDFPNIGKQIIHEHEEIAEKFVITLYALGLLSILGLVLNIKKNSKANIVAFLVLIVAAGCVILAKEVSTSGGEIRHTEIRENALTTGSDVEGAKE